MPRKLRVMHIIWGLEPGGAERQLATLALSQRRAHEVSVCCLERGGAIADELRAAGVEVTVLGKRPGLDLRLLFALAALLRKKRIDLVHSHIWGANLWSRLAAVLARTPLRVIHEHSAFTVDSIGRKLCDRFLSPFADACVCVSADIARRTLREVGVSADKVVLVRNGLELSRFADCAEERTRALALRAKSSLPPRIIIVGSLEPRKDHETFIRAADLLLSRGFKAEFAIAGDGPLAATLRSRVAELGREKEIVFLGAVADVRKLLCASAVYVSSSITEGVSIALLEALAAGVPAVATAVGGTLEVAQCGGGPECRIAAGELLRLVEPKNPQALADAIAVTLADPGAAAARAERARKMVNERFDAELMNRRILGLYEDLSARRSVGVPDSNQDAFRKKLRRPLAKRFLRFCLSRICGLRNLRLLSGQRGEARDNVAQAPSPEQNLGDSPSFPGEHTDGSGCPAEAKGLLGACRFSGSIKIPAGELRILAYHRVRDGFPSDRLSVSTADFSRQMFALAESGVPVMPLARAVDLLRSGELPRGAVALTFDDGYADLAENVLPTLREFGYSATAFVSPGLIERGGMIERYAYSPGAGRLLNWDETRRLRDGGWELGGHGLTHADLDALSGTALDEEISRCQELLAERAGARPAGFCYPRGRLSRSALACLEKNNCKFACTVFPGANTSATPPLLLRRTEVSGEDTLADFTAKLNGGFDFYQRLLQRGGATDPRRFA